LTVDNITINGNTISAGTGAVNITPAAGSAIVLDSTINVDAGVVTGATSITSTDFVGALTGNADTVTTNANLTGEVTSTGNAAVLDVTAISGQALVTAVATDMVLIQDATDGLLKRADASDFLGGSGNVTGDTASVENELVRFNGTGGKIIESPNTDNSNVTATLSDGADLTLYDAGNNTDPQIRLGANDTDELHISTTYAATSNDLALVTFQTDSSSVAAHAGQYLFNVDGASILNINDSGLDVQAGKEVLIGGVTKLTATGLGSLVVDSSLTSVGTLTGLTMGGDIAVGVNNITMTGSLGTTGSRLTKGWFTDLEVTNAIAGSITGNAATVTTNANLTGEVTSTGNAAVLDVTAISGQATVTPVSGDMVLIEDATDGLLKQVDASNFLAGSGDFKADGTVPMTGDFDGDGNNIDDIGVAFMREQAAADADVANQGQWWVQTGAPNLPMFTDDAGTDFQLTRSASKTQTGWVELATTAEIDTGTDSTRAMPVDQFVASDRNIRFINIRLVEAGTDVATGTTIGGDFEVPFAGTIYQDDAKDSYFCAYTDTAGTTGTMTVDVNKNGTSIMTTDLLSIETTEKSSSTATTPPNVTTPAVAAGDILTFDVDAIHTTAAKGLTVRIPIRMT
jgi:hypothetical protein